MQSASEHFTLRFAPGRAPTKLVVSLSKKNFKKAVTRNTIRRRVKAVVGPHLKGFLVGTYLIVGKPGAENVRAESLKNELKKLLRF